MKDYYRVLNCSRFVDNCELKKNFMRLCIEHHPDKTSHRSSAVIIEEVIEAWSVLGDENKKRVYDANFIKDTDKHEYLSFKHAWKVELINQELECPQCGQINQTEAATGLIECDSCSCLIDVAESTQEEPTLI